MKAADPPPKYRSWMLFLGGWTLVGLVFTAVNYAGSIAEGNRRFSLTEALRLNVDFFYLWALFSLFIFRFSRRFPIELRPLSLPNLLIHIPFVLGVAAIHD